MRRGGKRYYSVQPTAYSSELWEEKRAGVQAIPYLYPPYAGARRPPQERLICPPIRRSCRRLAASGAHKTNFDDVWSRCLSTRQQGDRCTPLHRQYILGSILQHRIHPWEQGVGEKGVGGEGGGHWTRMGRKVCPSMSCRWWCGVIAHLAVIWGASCRSA